jgi:hypothetical protein
MKRHFLECRSLSEMAITLTVLSVMFVFPLVFLFVFLGLVLQLPKYIAVLVTFGLWLLLIAAICWKFIKIGRAWTEPKLGIREFSYFQWSSGGLVLLFMLAFRSPETAPWITDLRWFLTFLFLMANLIYVSLAFAIRVKLPAKIFLFLLAGIAITLLPLWMN